MNELLLFTDGSVNTKSNIGYGAFLVVSEPGLSLEILKTQIKVKRFADTSSTKLELQTLLWALRKIQVTGRKIMVYTDSQNIVGLKARCARLEQNDYRSRKDRLLNNYQLYQEFYRLTNQLDCEFYKVRGHQASAQKLDMERLFALVDRAARSALRRDQS